MCLGMGWYGSVDSFHAGVSLMRVPVLINHLQCQEERKIKENKTERKKSSCGNCILV